MERKKKRKKKRKKTKYKKSLENYPTVVDFLNEENEARKAKRKEAAVLLSDSYVADCICNRSTLKRNDIKKYPELIEARRLIIKTKRLCKTLKN